MNLPSSWRLFLERDDIIGGEYKEIDGVTLLRGPISGIRVEGNFVYIQLLWCAIFNQQTKEWESDFVTPPPFSLNWEILNPKHNISDGSFCILIPFGNDRCMIFPKNHPDILNLDRVKNISR